MKLITVTQVKEDYAGTSTFSNTVRVSDIRCFYPRHNGKQGTRITFRDGGGFAVLDEYAALQEALVGQPERFVPVTQIKESYGSEPRPIPTVINAEAVRCFYPRHNESGTRLTFDDGGGFAIKEPFDYVLQALSDGTDHMVMPLAAPREPLQLVHSANNAADCSDWEDDDEAEIDERDYQEN